MSWFFGTPQPGDWIVTTKRVKVTLTDHLLGDDAGIRPGTRGVVTGTMGWNTLEARLDTGLLGPSTVRLKHGDVRVTRRGGGIEAHSRRTSRINLVRAGVAFALVAPFVYFVVAHYLSGGTTDGLIAAAIDSLLYGTLDLLAYAFTDPVNAALYVGVVWAAGRFAFR